MFLITTALGIIGREVVRKLVASGHPVRALVPRQKGAVELQRYLEEEDVSPDLMEVAIGSLDDEDSLTRALEGITGAALIVPASPGMVRVQKRFIELAASAGVEHVVLQSMHGPKSDTGSELHRLLEQTEVDLRGSGLAWTIIRSPAFLLMQNVRTQADHVQNTGQLALPLGSRRFHLIDARDIAAVLAVALVSVRVRGRSIDLTGPEALSGVELAQTLSDTIGYPVRYTPVPARVARAGMLRQRMPAWLVDDMLAMYGERDASRVNSAIEDLTGHPARTFADYIRDEAWAFERGDEDGQLKGWVETEALYMRT